MVFERVKIIIYGLLFTCVLAMSGCAGENNETNEFSDAATITEEMLDEEVSYEISEAQYNMPLDEFLSEEIAVSIGPEASRRYRCPCKKNGKTICYINTINPASGPCACRSGFGYRSGLKGVCKRS